jgi:hypothetical protein
MRHRIIPFDRRARLASPGLRGSVLRVDFRCRRCGYGIVVTRPPSEGCPMCHGVSWIRVGNRAPRVAHQVGRDAAVRRPIPTTKERP